MAAWTQHSSHIGGLTDRQKEVLDLIASGRTNPEIAEALGVSLAGAKWHVSEVISRLGVETREEATEVWREEHSLPRRFSNAFRGLFGLGVLKIAAVSTVGVAAVVGTAGAIVVLRDAGQATEPELAVAAQPTVLPEFPNAIYTRAEAKRVALDLAQGQFDLYNLPADISKNGRPVAVTDLSFGFYDFIESATTVIHKLSPSFWPNGANRNVWTFEFTAEGLDSPTGSSMVLSVIFEDGGTEVLDAGIMWPEHPGTLERSPMPAQPDRVVGNFSSGTDSWNIWAGPDGDNWVLGLSKVGDLNRAGLSAFGPIGPGLNPRDSIDMFGVTMFETQGYGYVLGAVTDNVARIEITVEDGRTDTLLPQLPPPGTDFPYRVFGGAYPGRAWVVEAAAYDIDGNLLGLVDVRNHPVNP